jgi:hypothetical protein
MSESNNNNPDYIEYYQLNVWCDSSNSKSYLVLKEKKVGLN